MAPPAIEAHTWRERRPPGADVGAPGKEGGPSALLPPLVPGPAGGEPGTQCRRMTIIFLERGETVTDHLSPAEARLLVNRILESGAPFVICVI